MIYLVDTNILLRFSRHEDPGYQIAREAVHKLEDGRHQLQTTLQNFAEFWNVSTRPTEQNGFGRTPVETNDLLRDLEEAFPLLPDLQTVYRVWRQFVVDYEVSGVQVHDARLVATMLVHDVTQILTFNRRDFIRYKREGITVIDPATV